MATVSLGEIEATLKVRDEMTAALEQARQRIATFSTELQRVGQRAADLGSALTRSLTLPLAAIGGGAVKLAIDFESSFAGVRKTVDATDAQFAELEATFRNMAKTIPVNVNELNRIGEAAGALGIKRQDIAGFVEVMAKLGVTTNLTSDAAADALARIQNIFGAAGKDTDRLASSLVALGNAGASTEQDIVSMGMRIAGAGNTIGLTQAQVLGIASALSSVGIEAEAGGSAISKVMIEIASSVASGGSQLERFASAAGMSAKDFSAAWRTDAAGALTTFIEGLGRMDGASGELLRTLSDLGIEEVRMRDALLRSAGAGQLLREQITLGSQAWRENNALTAEAEKRFETTASQLTILWNKIQDVGISLGQAMLPAVKALVTVVTAAVPVLEGLAMTFAGLPGPVQLGVLAFGALAAAAGPVLFVAGELIRTTGLVTAALTAQGAAATTAATGMTAASAATTGLRGILPGLAPLFNPITLAITAIGAAALYAASQIGEMRREMADAAREAKEHDELLKAFRVVTGDANSQGIDFSRLTPEQRAMLKQLVPQTNATMGLGIQIGAAQEGLSTRAGAAASPARVLTDEERKELDKRLDAHRKFSAEVRRLTFAPLAGLLKDLPGGVDLDRFGMGAKFAPPRLTSDDPFSGRFIWGANGIDNFMRSRAPLIPQLNTRVGGLDQVLAQFGGGRTLAPMPGASLADRLFGMSPQAFGARIGSTVTSAIAGGGNPLSAAGSQIGGGIGNRLSTSLGKTSFGASGVGSMLGSAMPVIGALLGPALSFLGDKFFGTKGRDTVRDFEKQFGGGDALRGKLDGLGLGDLNTRLFQNVGRNDEKGAKAAIEAVTKAIDASEKALTRYGLTLDDLKPPADRSASALKQLSDDIAIFERIGVRDVTRVATAMKGPLNDALKAALDTGQKLPASMRPYIEALAKSGGLTDELARKILGLPAPDTVPWKEMETIAEEFGIDLENLGVKFQQSKLIENGDELARKFRLLVDNGADVRAVIGGMKDKANEYLGAALRWGLEIPPSMQPMFRAMFEAGELVDENGDKIEDFNTLKFGVDLTESIGDLIEKLDDLIERLGGIPDPEITPIINAPVYRGAPGSPQPGPGRDGYEDFDGAGHWYPGYVPPTPGGTPFRLGDGGEGEYIIPASLMRGSVGGASHVTVQVMAWDGASVDAWLRGGGDRKLAESLVPQLARYAKRMN